jgi:hypothetical protein
VLAGFLLGIAGTGALSRGFLALTACFTYWALLYLPEFVPGSEMKVPAVARVWLPDIVLVAIALIVASSRLRGSVIEAPH